MKRFFRYLIMCASLIILTACQKQNSDLEVQEGSSTTEVLNKEEEVFDYYIVSSNKAKLYSSPSMESEQIDQLYKNSLIKVSDSEYEFWKKVRMDNNKTSYIFLNDIQFVGGEYNNYIDYQIVDNVEKYALINVDVGNIRRIPNIDGEILGKIKYGETIIILGVTKNNWNIIMYNDNICYISSEIITYISKEEYNQYNFKITKSNFDENNAILIGTYTTNYAPINCNRGYNVELGSKNIDGLIIPSGSLFNWCRDMGECGKEDGYKESTEILNGKYVTGYGGGICQVSSTLCAAISTSDGNFEFFERHKHSKAQKYIPRELDATVSFPNVNLIIKNCNKYPIMIKSYCNNGNITVEIYAINE